MAKPLNNRLDFLKESTPRRYSPQKKYSPPQPLNNRVHNLKNYSPPAPSRISEPPIRNFARKNTPRIINDRFQHLKANKIKEPKKKTFVAFPSRNDWDKGFRPAWILRSNKDPPENYDEAYKIYKHYLQEDEIVIPDKKLVGDKAKQISTQYMNKLNRK